MVSSLKQANKVVHKVEDQWHYDTMTKYGFVPLDKTGTGLVRRYRYVHPDTNHSIEVSTGYSADHWTDKTTGAHGYWSALEPHLQKITQGKETVKDAIEQTIDMLEETGDSWPPSLSQMSKIREIETGVEGVVGKPSYGSAFYGSGRTMKFQFPTKEAAQKAEKDVKRYLNNQAVVDKGKTDVVAYTDDNPYIDADASQEYLSVVFAITVNEEADPIEQAIDMLVEVEAKDLAYDEGFVEWWMAKMNKLSPEEREERIGDIEEIDYGIAQNWIHNLLDDEALASEWRSYKRWKRRQR